MRRCVGGEEEGSRKEVGIPCQVHGLYGMGLYDRDGVSALLIVDLYMH